MDFTGDGGTLVICDGDCIRWVDVATREVRAARIVGLPPGHRRYAPLDAFSDRVLCVVQGCLFVGEPGRDTLRTRAFDRIGDFTAAAGTADGRALITGSRDGVVRVRDRVSGAVLAVTEIEQPVVDVAASADGREVFVVGRSGDLLRFDLASGAEIAREARLRPATVRRAPSGGVHERSFDGDNVVLFVHWLSPDVGDDDAVEDCRHLLSRDGRLLWRLWTTTDLAEQVAVTAVDPPARLAYARWTLNAHFATFRAGRALLAVVAGFATLWLLSGNGRSVRTEWPGGCRLLGFAPDDRALWVRDASGLLAEVAVPEELLEDLERIAPPPLDRG